MGDPVILALDNKIAWIAAGVTVQRAVRRFQKERIQGVLRACSLCPPDHLRGMPEIFQHLVKNFASFYRGREKPFDVLHDEDGRLVNGKNSQVLFIEINPMIVFSNATIP